MINVQHKVTDYKIVSGDTPRVQEEVCRCLEEGWKLYGPLTSDPAKGYHSQAMVKIEDNWRGE